MTRFIWDGNALAMEYDAAGNILRRYTHGPNRAADDPIVWDEGSGVTCASARFLMRDQQNSVVTAADCSGNRLLVNRYDEYGIPQGSNVGRFQYTGQAWIAELGMYHYKARFYSPTLGRFMQTDPIGYEDGVNLYAYVGNDPINGTDPTGMWRCPARDATGKIDQNCITAMRDQAQAAARIAVETGKVAQLAGKMQKGERLGKEDRALIVRLERYLGKGSASTADGLKLIARSAAAINGVLGGKLPITIGGNLLGRPAATNLNGTRLADEYFYMKNANDRQGVLAHEAAHNGLSIYGDVYGRAQTEALARSDPSRAWRNADNWMYALGF